MGYTSSIPATRNLQALVNCLPRNDSTFSDVWGRIVRMERSSARLKEMSWLAWESVKAALSKIGPIADTAFLFFGLAGAVILVCTNQPTGMAITVLAFVAAAMTFSEPSPWQRRTFILLAGALFFLKSERFRMTIKNNKKPSPHNKKKDAISWRQFWRATGRALKRYYLTTRIASKPRCKNLM